MLKQNEGLELLKGISLADFFIEKHEFEGVLSDEPLAIRIKARKFHETLIIGTNSSGDGFTFYFSPNAPPDMGESGRCVLLPQFSDEGFREMKIGHATIQKYRYGEELKLMLNDGSHVHYRIDGGDVLWVSHDQSVGS